MKSLLSSVKTMLKNPKENRPDIAIATPPAIAPTIIDATQSEGYLAGHLLVATPLINTGCFQKSVVYIFAHNTEGAMGLIVNQPLELVNYASLVEGMNLPENAKHIPVCFGGPLDRSRGFVIHSTDYFKEFSLARTNEIAVTASSSILADIAEGKGPKHASLVVGYAGWAPGQLEQEIEQNSWLSVPASGKLIFHTEDDLKWVTASESLGVNMAFFSTTVGHA